MKRMRIEMEPSASLASTSSPASSASAATTSSNSRSIDRDGTRENDNHTSCENEADTLATSPTAASIFARQRPAYEKLAIGPLMVFGEMITGGHYLEVLRLGKQMTTGRSASDCPSYRSLHQTCVADSGGFVPAFYRGFLPWGLAQCLKGVPVLFVQSEALYQLRTRAGWSQGAAEKASGFIGGASMGIFVCPLQVVKVQVVASPHMNAMSPFQACVKVVREKGLSSLYHGLLPMTIRRSLDWGIRFTVSSEVKSRVVERRRAAGRSTDLPVIELIGCGLVGGAFSALTHPIDNVITNSQKPMPPGAKRDLLSVVKRMYAESGHRAFTRGFAIKIVDNAYHMAWMYGVGTVVYDHIRNTLTPEGGRM
mmetsp:Transcript_12404/g.35490  ORF Transcript_12404/g.35490 Transcript_12404/m.35490 type:complete len:367 (-) Transcript_12404:218-1318(-)